MTHMPSQIPWRVMNVNELDLLYIVYVLLTYFQLNTYSLQLFFTFFVSCMFL